MERIETSLPGVLELRPAIFKDNRGVFLETYHQNKFVDFGIEDRFVQDNHSCSTQGTLRGLHYQLVHPQAKLCWVVEGEVLDIAVDIRRGSPYFGKWTGVRLSAKERNQIYIPRGFAHGFLALTQTVQFIYKCSDFHSAQSARGSSIHQYFCYRRRRHRRNIGGRAGALAHTGDSLVTASCAMGPL